jgi:hypothetical protein
MNRWICLVGFIDHGSVCGLFRFGLLSRQLHEVSLIS